MSAQPIVTQIGQNMRLLRIQCDNTKTTCLSVALQMPLRKNTAEHLLLSSFLSHTSKTYPTLAKLSAQLEELYGAILSVDTRKLGESYCLRFSITCLKDSLALKGESLSKAALQLLLDLLLNPKAQNGAFDAKQFATEQRICIADLESILNDKRAYALGRLVEIMCQNEAYGLSHTALLEEVKAVTPERLYTAWQTLLREAVVSITVVGDEDFSEIEKLLQARFAALPDRKPQSTVTLYKTEVEAVKEVEEEMDVSQSKLCLGFRTAMQDKNDRYFAHRVLADLFGGGPYSRLFTYVREKKSLCYYCSARLDRLKGILFVQSGIEQANKAAAQAEILKQLDVLRRGEFSDEELAASKAALCDLFRGIEDTTESLDAFYAFKTEGTVHTPAHFIKGIEAVTRADVIAAAKGVRLDTVYLLTGKEATVCPN